MTPTTKPEQSPLSADAREAMERCDALLAAYGQKYTAHFNCKDITLLCAELLRLAAENERWIPVTERLPEPNVNVLAVIILDNSASDHPDDKDVQRVVAITFRWTPEPGRTVWMESVREVVTHWMPLPEPPQ